MRWSLKALAVACAVAGLTGFGHAQFRIAPQSAGTASAAGSMPGQTVGSSYNLNPGGSTIPRAAPQAGTPIGNPLTRPYDPSRPMDMFKGSGIDPKTVVTPLSAFPGLPTQNPSILDRLNSKLGSVVTYFRPSEPPRPTYTPGISRRNRERAMERNWRRD